MHRLNFTQPASGVTLSPEVGEVSLLPSYKNDKRDR